MATKGYQKRTPEERARWRENQARLERLIEQALAALGTTREELRRQLNLPDPRRNTG